MIEKKELIEILKRLDFSEKEAMVYLTLLELNEALPSAIARKSGIKRSTTYQILEQLQAKGLVSHIKRHNSRFYRAENSDNFLSEKKDEIENIKSSIKTLKAELPKIRTLYKELSRPHMSVYTGRKGILQIMEDILSSTSEILCWTNPTLLSAWLGAKHKNYLRKKFSRKIKLRAIFCEEKIKAEKSYLKKYKPEKIHIIPKKEFPFDNDINIYGDKVAIISYSDELGIIIQNKTIADAQRAIFEICFKNTTNKGLTKMT